MKDYLQRLLRRKLASATSLAERRRRRSFIGDVSRRGAIVLLAILLVGASSLFVSAQFLEDVTDQYLAVRSSADGLRAREAALAGFNAGITAVKTIPEEFLYQQGIIMDPPALPLGKKCFDDEETDCLKFKVSYQILPEDGRINLNNLVRYDDQINENYNRIVRRLFRQLDIPGDHVDAVTDWIDENDYTEPAGAEDDHYAALKPPRKIKNYRMFSLSELPAIKGFDRNMVYESRAPEGWEERQEELAFQTDDEINLLQPEDWILANNVTAFMPFTESVEDKVNINAARFHVMMSLSDAMSREAVLAIFKYRRQNNGYIKNVSELRDLPELNVPGGIPEVTLYQELAGTGGDVSGLIKTESDYYQIVGVGYVMRETDNTSDILAERKVRGIWDKNNRRLVYYSED